MSPLSNRWPSHRLFAAGYIIAIVFLLVDFAVTYYNLSLTDRSWSAAAASRDIVAGCDEVLSQLKDAETGQRLSADRR
jgi:CHASE3 domain sensor protein